MTAVTARRLVMSALAWFLAAGAIGLVFLSIGFGEKDGWVFTVVDSVALWASTMAAVRVWNWSKP